MPTPDFGSPWHQSQLNTVDSEIARLAAVCDIRMLDPGVIERVMADDETVCGRRSPKAFRQLQGLVKMHYALANDSIQALGAEESGKILDQIRTRLRQRYDIGGER